MIMKANKQIGFIYKDNESIDRILKDGEVVFERGFLREKTSTTLPITFGGVGKDLKDYRVYGNTKQQILPDGYTQVDYIESSGTQYIDTGYYGNLNTEVQLKATNSSSNLDRQLFGDITTSSQAISCNLSLSTRLTSRFGNKSVGLTFGDYVSENEIFTLIENKDGIYINNSQIATFDTIDNFSTPNSLLLLTRNSASGAGTVWNGKLYYAKIYDNNMLVRDFIPCYRNSDNEVGLYDLVNNVFYTNQGTGVFTYGNVAPTPDAPIEMVSCGDRTKNLCGELEQGGYNETTGAKITSSNYRNKEPIKVLPNTNYIFSINGVGQAINAFEYKADGTYIGRIGGGTISANTYFTTSSETAYINIFRGTSAGIEKWQIEQSDTVTPYEPYGYKIPVNVRSENLATNFDKGWYNGPTQVFTNANNFKRCTAKIKPNTTYTISKKNASNRFVVITSEFEIAPNVQYKRLVIAEFNTNRKVLSFTTQEDENYLFFGYYSGTDETEIELAEEEIMIVEGSTTPSKYIPYYNQTTNIYLDEPLRKIDEYSDYINFINGKVVRNIKEHIFTGTNDDKYVFNSDNTNTLGINILPNKIDSPALKPMSYMGPPIICNKFDYLNDITDKEHIYSSNGQQIDETKRISNIRLYINKSRLEGYSSSMTNTQKIELLKTWLSSNNITVDYILLSPTEETITLPNIPTVDENNTLNIETEIMSSQVYIKYKSNT